MAFVYEINGKRVEFEKEPSERDIDEAAKSIGVAAPKPESAMPTPVEGAGGAAFGVYRPAGRRPESQQDKEAALEMAPQTIRGLASNFFLPFGLPVDIANAVYNAPRTAEDIANRYQSVKSQLAGNERQPLPELPAKQTIPVIGEYGSHFYNQLLPGEPTSPAGQLAFAGGQLMGAPILTKAMSVAAPIITSPIQTAKAVGQTAKTVAQATPEFARGVMAEVGGGGTRPGQRATYAGQYESARQPAGNAYYPDADLDAWRKNLITTQELEKRAAYYTPEQQAALRKTGGMVPYEGQVARATGEALAEPYTKLSGYLPDLALAGVGYALGGPLGAAAVPAANLVRRGVGLYQAGRTAGGMRQLGDLGFSPLFPEELAALNKGLPHPSALGPAASAGNVPTTGPLAAVVAQTKQNYPTYTAAGAVSPEMVQGQAKIVQSVPAKEVSMADLVARRDTLERANANAMLSGRPTGPIPENLQNVKPSKTAEEIVNDTLAQKQAAAEKKQAILDQIAANNEKKRLAAEEQKAQAVQNAAEAKIMRAAETQKVETTGPVVPVETPEKPFVAKTEYKPIKSAVKTREDLIADRARVIEINKILVAQGRKPLAVPEIPPAPLDEATLAKPGSSLSDIKAKLANRTPEQKAADETAVRASENKSVAQKAAQGKRGEIQTELKTTAQAGIVSKGNTLSIDKSLFNEMAATHGAKINWKEVPDVSNMSLKQGREVVRKHLYKEIAEQAKTNTSSGMAALENIVNGKKK
ncbi:hypothetical protein UFOVP180_23 [uncultured Caudovirales phage]|uniref:Uncharacterized protein n=1 Tax=uncultured Caudovirales phage TaxID=2100421 RepID=A0A6J7WCV7_9CAUD|nr:hypothetical protein UFOVP180_23 [uncultured Caudovirales phage]